MALLKEYKEAAEAIKAGGIAVIPTDTIYGVVASALNKDAVEKIYKLKGRPPEKPFIILVSDFEQLKYFDVMAVKDLADYWPGRVSIILETQSDKKYLHRGTGTLAFRMPDKKELLELIHKTGPLVAPSANPSGMEPAKDINEAKAYFGEGADYYLDEGMLNGRPSALIKIVGSKVEYLRK